MKLYNKEDLRNSRIFFDKKPPKFMIFLVYFLIFSVIMSILGAGKINKNYIVKAQGSIADKNIVYHSSNVNGTVIKLIKNEGDYVKEDESILIISNGEENTQRKEYEKILKENKEKLELLNKYRNSLDTKQNLLKDMGAEQEYYGKVEYYLSGLKGDGLNKSFLNEDIGKKQHKLALKINEKNELGNSIKNLEENKKYYDKLASDYEKLNYEISDLEAEILQLKSNEKENSNLIKIKEKELKVKKEKYRENSKILENKAKSENEYQTTKSKIESLTSEIDGLGEEIKQLNRQQVSPKQSNQIYFQLINEIGAEIKTIEKNNADINLNISVLSKRDKNYELKAKKSGKIHFLNNIKEGLNVQANQPLLEISTLEKENYYVDAYVNIIDISKIKINQDVDISIIGVNTYKYGTLKGKIKYIENGTTSIQTQEGNKSFYKVKVELETKELLSKKDKIKLFLSMPVEARIIYDKETYLDYILEKLSFKE
ncbi:HlyD family efflux transporter periplasmic adaptor subunit [Helcococcus bovis]|uniref:HlyD family efflux transporter periplasmic adaptor subunit n=1 Tax=Helcococcus bovis TaxID=3153252 RepID=UPI0038B83434